MKVATLCIPGRLPGLNELMLDRGSRIRVKAKWCKTVALIARTSCTPRFDRGAYVHIECVEPNRKRDPDGVCSGAAKVVLDGLVKCGVLAGDGWGHILGLSYSWRVDAAEPCVVVTLSSGPLACRQDGRGDLVR